MGQYADVNGVHTWYDERGDGDPLVLLHGSPGDSRVFDAGLAPLADRFRVLTPERRGHGHTADVEGPIGLGVMTDDTVAFLEQVVADPARLAGHGTGATVALMTAIRRPDLVERLVLISGAFQREGMVLRPGPSGEVPPEVADAYAEVSPDGRDHLPVVLEKTAASAATEPDLTEHELSAVTARTLVVSGDDDLVTLEHTVALYRALPAAELAVVPGTSHALLLEKPGTLRHLVGDFLTGEPPATRLPIRRTR
ncbi:alpha/beta fold hydrolase [Nocardiopsis sediminis]|uniref:Alpha/beta fold hydrolase n=1 Tax=Nocardiopsis sediminis TaxID=1778267 RepID=A0ABV8FLS4_9ACTN